MDDMKKNETVQPATALAEEQVMNTQYQELSAKAEHLYRFVNQFKASFHKPRDYSGHYINMVEVHDLTYIDDHPGTTATHMAKTTRRTRGAVSQVLSKLENNNLIRREQSPDNASVMLLYTTETGKQISDAHKRHDVFMLNAMNRVLSRHFSDEEIDSFYRILQFLSIEMTHEYGRGGAAKQPPEPK